MKTSDILFFCSLLFLVSCEKQTDLPTQTSNQLVLKSSSVEDFRFTFTMQLGHDLTNMCNGYCFHTSVSNPFWFHVPKWGYGNDYERQFTVWIPKAGKLQISTPASVHSYMCYTDIKDGTSVNGVYPFKKCSIQIKNATELNGYYLNFNSDRWGAQAYPYTYRDDITFSKQPWY